MKLTTRRDDVGWFQMNDWLAELREDHDDYDDHDDHDDRDDRAGEPAGDDFPQPEAPAAVPPRMAADPESCPPAGRAWPPARQARRLPRKAASRSRPAQFPPPDTGFLSPCARLPFPGRPGPAR